MGTKEPLLLRMRKYFNYTWGEPELAPNRGRRAVLDCGRRWTIARRTQLTDPGGGGGGVQRRASPPPSLTSRAPRPVASVHSVRTYRALAVSLGPGPALRPLRPWSDQRKKELLPVYFPDGRRCHRCVSEATDELCFRKFHVFPFTVWCDFWVFQVISHLQFVG